MITDWIAVQHIKVSKAERLYPRGLNWKIQPGVNAIVGGTSLGKTTLIYALQFAIFEKMIIDGGERIERDFFKNRLTSRSEEKVKEDPPTIEVDFTIGKSSFRINRNLLTGALITATCGTESLTAAKYRELVAQKVGLEKDFESVSRLQSHLLFFGEGRYLLAWDNLAQNQLLNLLLSDHEKYLELNDLWGKTESADSEARNASAQASRMERDIEGLTGSNNVQELERKSALVQISTARSVSEKELENIEKGISIEEKNLAAQNAEINQAEAAFHRELDTLESATSGDIDAMLLTAALAESPTIASVRRSLEAFVKNPDDRLCPCCGRVGISNSIARLIQEAAKAASDGNCVVCSKELVSGSASSERRPKSADAADKSAARLQSLLFVREQIRSRLESLRGDESRITKRLLEERDIEQTHRSSGSASAIEPMRIAISELRRRQHRAEARRDESIRELRKKLKLANARFQNVQAGIAKAFKKYASLYLDEKCDVELLKETELPGRKGPQVKAPHAAFYPIVAGQKRPSAQALSDAQRSFVDLALRMAIIEVWRKETGKSVTLIVETPEGAVDLAYMERVATMLRTFANQGHTLIVTTNLNNEYFLPELLASHPKSERLRRILNLIQEGKPHRVQEIHHKQFEKILDSVSSHAFVTE
jgi:AAA domain-containing protein